MPLAHAMSDHLEIADSTVGSFPRRPHTPTHRSERDRVGEKVALRPRPIRSTTEKSPPLHRCRHRWTCRDDKPTATPAWLLLRPACSCNSSTNRNRCTVCTASVRRRTAIRASCKNAAGKVQSTGRGPGTSGLHSPGQKLPIALYRTPRTNRDAICETDHLGRLPVFRSTLHQLFAQLRANAVGGSDTTHRYSRGFRGDKGAGGVRRFRPTLPTQGGILRVRARRQSRRQMATRGPVGAT